MDIKGGWELFCQELGKQKTIYDLLVLLFLQIDGAKKPYYIREYYKNLNQVKKEYWGDLSQLTNEMLMQSISFEYFMAQFAKCIRQDNFRNIAIRMLFAFDRYLKERSKYPALALEREGMVGGLYNMGPLNHVDSVHGLYLMPDFHYFKDVNKEYGLNIRFMDQSAFHGIDEGIKNYKIVKNDEMEKKVKIQSYKGGYETKENKEELKLGIVPVSKFLWCEVDYFEYQGKNYFRLKDKAEESESINNAYLELLQRCMDEKISIVVFPELAQNKDTERIVRDFLFRSYMMGQDTPDLVFLGSLWKEGKNEGVLLSGNGSVLLRNQKVNAFSVEYQGKRYWEDLDEEAKVIQLLDIPVIGRIQYLICKDGLDDALQHYIWNVFEVSCSIISSFSDSIIHFEDIGESFGKMYAGIQVLGNACAARMEHSDEIGHVIAPCGKEKKAPSFQKERYKAIEHCKKDCKFGGCIQVLKISPSELVERVGTPRHYITSECIIL